MSDPSQYNLASPPFDTVSALRFSPTNPDHLLVASWDSTLRLYDVEANTEKAKFDQRAAVLACTFSDATRAYCGGLDTAVRAMNLENEHVESIGTHNDAVSALVHAKMTGAIISGSWDCSVRIWDPRAASPQQSEHKVADRVYQMDIVNNTLVVAQASRQFTIFDIRNMGEGQTRESSLKYMTRSLACMADGQGYSTASVEGRIAVEYFDPSPEVQEKKYAFKCHRSTIEEVDHVWPVNALAFHPVYNTFVSGGSDGTVSIWDHKVKKRLRQYPKYSSPVSALAFNADGTKLAAATSYTWDEGEAGGRTAERPSIWVRRLGDEVKPKNWS